MKPFRERYRAALSDHNVRDGLLGFQRSWRETRDERVAELEELTGASFKTLRSDLASVKDGVIADLDGHVARFRAAAEANGAVVYEAASAEEANRYIADLCRERGVDAVVKGKSMVSEEIELNDFLAAEGVAAVESDLGEWILQLEHDHPSHLVMPAIHRRRDQVAETLGRALGTSFDPDDIPGMVHSARGGLREAFLRAGVGLTGANALIAESGTAMVITNEGNGRLTASLPPVHVVTAGIEKIVPSFQDAIRQVRLLPRSATGQSITSYTTFVSGPTEGHELHIVLLDNGRRAMASDPQFASALRCVRCGACANVCPPYQIVGGHGFGHIYPGAIGLVTTPFHHGLEAAAGPQSLCVSCGACATVCPVAIPLPQQILGVRRRVAEEQGLPLWQRAALRAWRSRRAAAVGFRTIGLLSMPLRRGSVIRVPRRLPWSTRWIGWRTPPAISTQPAHARMAPHAQRRPLAETRATGRRVLLPPPVLGRPGHTGDVGCCGSASASSRRGGGDSPATALLRLARLRRGGSRRGPADGTRHVARLRWRGRRGHTGTELRRRHIARLPGAVRRRARMGRARGAADGARPRSGVVSGRAGATTRRDAGSGRRRAGCGASLLPGRQFPRGRCTARGFGDGSV